MSFRQFSYDESPRGSMVAFPGVAGTNGAMTSSSNSASYHVNNFYSSASSSNQRPLNHLRRRSSVTSGPTSVLSSPYVYHGRYDERSGEIALPPSPPLPVWKEKNALGLDVLSNADDKPFKKGRKYWGPVPWRPVLGLVAVTVSFITLVSYLIPPTSQYAPGAILSRMRSAQECEPFSSFGTLMVDSHDADKNQWVPFDPTCTPPAFMAQLRGERPIRSMSKSSQASTDAFAWLRHKTALIIGDAVSREHVENFCQLLGEESVAIRPGHKYAPQDTPARAASKASHHVDKPNRLDGRASRLMRDTGRPRLCYIPKHDFMLVSVLHFGLDQEDFWRDKNMPQYSAPGTFEHRLSDLAEPIMAAIRADNRPSAPDFVEVTSGAWDLARWGEQDVSAGQETTSGLAQDRVTWYRFRVGQVLDKVRTAFPKAKARTWRTTHYPVDQVAEKDYFQDKISTRNSSTTTEQPYFSHNRIYQLDQAVRTLILPSNGGDAESTPAPHADFRINEWGPILKGHQAHHKDRLHGDPLPGGYVWSDIMLYELWRSVRDGEQKPASHASPRTGPNSSRDSAA